VKQVTTIHANGVPQEAFAIAIAIVITIATATNRFEIPNVSLGGRYQQPSIGFVSGPEVARNSNR